MRVFELAKELNISSRELTEKLRTLGINARSHMTALAEDEVNKVIAMVPSRSSAKVEIPTPAPVKVEMEADETADTPSPEETDGEQPSEDESKLIDLDGPVIVKDFAQQLGMKPNQVIAELMMRNVFASINQEIDKKIAADIAEKHGFKRLEKKAPEVEEKEAEPQEEEAEDGTTASERKKKKKKRKKAEDKLEHPEEQLPRPPIVTFLGHVDHGKTSLLDQIRKTQVASGESGGITQHIGAYQVEYQDQIITFLDTPGHAAFTTMRARGANVTDIAVLIVAADDGIMPQTREAIQHAKAAEVTIMVAINKIDLPGANVDRVLQQLQHEGLMPETWGGDIICCPVSAQTGEGIENLLEMLLLQSEMMELTANPKQDAEGYVLEAEMETGRGPTATLLVTDGTLKVGDAVVCGSTWGRMKALMNDRGVKVRTAGPSAAVRCLGLTSVPDAGDSFDVYSNDRDAKMIAEERQASERTENLAVTRQTSVEDLLMQTSGNDKKVLPVVLKADVKGSLEALESSILQIESDKVEVNLVLSGVGNITENDVLLAAASHAIIVGFHIGISGATKKSAKHSDVNIRLYSIIYELLDDIEKMMAGLLEPELQENVIGKAEVRQIFTIGKKGNVAGCMAIQGRFHSNARARIIRAKESIYEGSVNTLKRFQNDAKEIREGQECGIRLDNFSDYKEGDIIEFYDIKKITQAL